MVGTFCLGRTGYKSIHSRPIRDTKTLPSVAHGIDIPENFRSPAKITRMFGSNGQAI